MGKLLINKMAGMNTSRGALQLQPGEISNLQNFRPRPFSNWKKRQGIEYVSSSSSPINGIYELELDNITIPIVQSGNVLTFFPDLTSANGTFLNPNPYAPAGWNVEPPDAPSRAVLFLIEPTMRAAQNRYQFSVSHPYRSAFTWPNLIFAADGTRLNGATGVAVSAYPANNLYGPDLSYHDSFYGNPLGTRAAFLINSIIDASRSAVTNGSYVNGAVEGQSTITVYTTSIMPNASSATTANYESKLEACKTGLRLLTKTKIQDTDTTDVETRSATYPAGCGTCFKITGYTDSTFSLAGCDPVIPPSSDSVWDGTLPIVAISGSFCSATNGVGPYSVQGKAFSSSIINEGPDNITGDPVYYIAFNMSVVGQVWVGKSTTATTMAGTYTFFPDAGLDCSTTGPASITIEAC